MKKLLFTVLAVSALFIITSCDNPAKTSVKSDPSQAEETEDKETEDKETEDKEEPEEEEIDSDLEHPGEVESVSFTVSDIPTSVTDVYIYRKYNTDVDFEIYANYYPFGTKTENYSFTFCDDFVEPGKTYRYKYCYWINSVCTSIEVMNGETKNFTPTTGAGELGFKEPVPSSTYDSATTELSFEQNLELTVVLPEEKNYGTSLFVFDESKWMGHTVQFDTNKTFNLWDLYKNAGRGTYNIKKMSPGVNSTNFSDDYSEGYSISIYGNSIDISEKNITLRYAEEGLMLENVENGIKVTVGHPYSYSSETWNTRKIEIYEDDVKLDYSYYLSETLETGEEKSFVFPFITKGKTYTFKYSPCDGTSFTKNITAQTTTDLIVDSNKILNNVTNAIITYEDKDTEDSQSRILKISSDITDIFTGNAASILKYKTVSAHIYRGEKADNNWLGIIVNNNEQYNALKSGGLELLSASAIYSSYLSDYGVYSRLNESKKFYVETYIGFAVEDEASAPGYFEITGPESEVFDWNEVDLTPFQEE